MLTRVNFEKLEIVLQTVYIFRTTDKTTEIIEKILCNVNIKILRYHYSFGNFIFAMVVIRHKAC